MADNTQAWDDYVLHLEEQIDAERVRAADWADRNSGR